MNNIQGVKKFDDYLASHCLVPVWLSPRPSRSIRISELSKTNSLEHTFCLGPRDPKTIDRGEIYRPGN